jgi:prepilin-type N-terminal cleavage/methylation domain-containing protein
MNSRRSSSGFTIIETLIVLAVAGIIMLIVFQAIPALQRNARNNQRRQDVATVLEAVSHWELNNSGTIPSSSDNYLQYTQKRLTAYDPAQIQIHGQSTDPASPNKASNQAAKSGTSALDELDVYNYEKCDTANPGAATIQGAGYSDAVALYAVETGNGVVGQCKEL